MKIKIRGKSNINYDIVERKVSGKSGSAGGI